MERRNKRRQEKLDALRAERKARGETVTTETQESKRVLRPEQQVDDAALEEMACSDEFASFFAGQTTPRLLITTNPDARKDAHRFGAELADLFPNSEYRVRPHKTMLRDVVAEAAKRDYTHAVVVGESRKALDTLTVVKLPEGPAAVFKLTSVVLGKGIAGHGRSSGHAPELVLQGFATRLGHRVGRMLVSLFPPAPEFRGRQVVTFHCQRDFIFVRRHRYVFESGTRARLQEIGPQFTLKLHRLYRAAHSFGTSVPEFVWDPSHARTDFTI